jgi:hypothetical protein
MSHPLSFTCDLVRITIRMDEGSHRLGYGLDPLLSNEDSPPLGEVVDRLIPGVRVGISRRGRKPTAETFRDPLAVSALPLCCGDGFVEPMASRAQWSRHGGQAVQIFAASLRTKVIDERSLVFMKVASRARVIEVKET